MSTEPTNQETLALVERLHKVTTDELLTMLRGKQVDLEYLAIVLVSVAINVIGGASGQKPSVEIVDRITKMMVLELITTRKVIIDTITKDLEELHNANA
jgi:hypothetical protein